MAQDQLDLTPQDTLALSAAMRRPLTDLFTRIRAIAAGGAAAGWLPPAAPGR